MAGYPPGPQGQWFAGHLPAFRQDRLGFLTRCARTYGDVAAFRLGWRRVFLVSHPAAIEEVLVTQGRQFRKHFALRLNPLVFGNGLLTSEGDFWLRQRRLLQPAFQRQRVAEYAPLMTARTERLLADWQPGQVRDLQADLMALTLDIAARALFSGEAGGKAPEVRAALNVLQETFLSRFNRLVPLPTWVPTPRNLRLRRAVRRLDRILYEFFQQRRQSGNRGHDLLSLLLQARDEQDQTGMTDRQLRDEAMTLFLAGHETTALALCWTWYLLAQHAAVEERLAAEVRQVLTSNRLPTADDVPRLAYVEKVVLESMRLYPPVYVIGREALREVMIGGYRVPKGTTLMLSPWVVQRDPRFWEQPEQFLPERWSREQQEGRPKFAYFPFGGGPRICLGNHFALLETVLILATIARTFRFTLEPGQTIVPMPTFTLRPAASILVRVTPR